MEEAKKFCEKNGMAVLSLGTADEVNKISDYIKYIGRHK
jgi:hypothetical protein